MEEYRIMMELYYKSQNREDYYELYEKYVDVYKRQVIISLGSYLGRWLAYAGF